jgi:signal transduction histidine kinase
VKDGQVVDILMVDDREENLLALDAVLAAPGHRLIRASSGQEALDYLVDHECAVILLDVQMPKMDGFEVARRIRAGGLNRHTPIIFLTAIYRSDQYAQAGYEVGAVDFMMKPLDVPALRSKVAVFVDLHLKSRKLLEQEKLLYQSSLRMTEERLRAVISHASVLLWSIDVNGTFTLCEGRGFRDRNLDPAELVGCSAFDFFADNPNAVANLHRALRGETFVAEVLDGGEWYEVHHAPLYGDDGAITGAICVSSEVTLRKKAEIDLQQALQIRDEFLSIASHELKTPLTPLRLQLQLMQRQAKLEPSGFMATSEIVAKLDMAEAQIVRLNKLVEDLLDVSRMANRRLSIQREDMDLATVAREVVQRFTEPASIAGCTLTLIAPPLLPGRWDRMRIEQILTNLISNAVKYGGSKPISICLEQVGASAQLTVEDHGIGISYENQDRVFERFERAAPGSEFGGLGLGLYIVRQLVEAHGGRIWVASEVGKGSVFTLTLPCMPASSGSSGLTRAMGQSSEAKSG